MRHGIFGTTFLGDSDIDRRTGRLSEIRVRGYDGSDAARLTSTVNLHSGYQGEGSLAGTTDAMRDRLDLTLLSVQWRIEIVLRILRLSGIISA